MSIQYGNSNPITITAGSLGSGNARSSAPVTTSLTSNIDQIMLTVNVLTTTTALSSPYQVVVYGYFSEDGTNYNGGSATNDVVGADASCTVGSPTNLIFLGTIQLNTSGSAVTERGVFEVTSKFGCIPRKWGIVLLNQCGTALGATVTATYTEVSYN